MWYQLIFPNSLSTTISSPIQARLANRSRIFKLKLDRLLYTCCTCSVYNYNRKPVSTRDRPPETTKLLLFHRPQTRPTASALADCFNFQLCYFFQVHPITNQFLCRCTYVYLSLSIPTACIALFNVSAGAQSSSTS